jgi:anaerobic selenocysteine-containing dehydrogenase
MEFSRRDFLTFAGFTAVGVLGGRYLKNQILPYETYYLGNDFRKRKEEFQTGVCGMCPAGCGIRARLVDGQLVKIDGNPDCSLARGGLCSRGQMGVELHFNPDRLAGPLQRNGRAGTQSWQSVPWDGALAVLREKLSQAKANGKKRSIAVLCTEERSIRTELWHQVLEQAGSADGLVFVNPLRDEAARAAVAAFSGSAGWPVYDIRHSDTLFVFDTPAFSGWSNTTAIARAYGDFRRSNVSRGKLIFIGSRRGLEGLAADVFVPVKPYTSPILALGLMHVLVSEGLFDSSFVTNSCRGFELIKDMVSRHFDLDVVSARTGVPIETINALAREFGASTRPLAIGERRPQPSHAWEQLVYMSLNALKGSIGVPGGIVVREELPLKTVRSMQGGAQPTQGTRVEAFIENALADDRNLPEVLFIDGVNLSLLGAYESRWRQLLERVPFVVTFSPYPDSSAQVADLVLPDLDFVETSHDLLPGPDVEIPSVAVASPVVSPLVDGKDTRLVQLHLLDPDFRERGAVSWKRAEDQLSGLRLALHRELFEARRGLVNDSVTSGDWMQRMESGGWWTTELKDFDSFDRQLEAKGGWADPYVSDTARRRRTMGRNGQFDLKALVDTLPVSELLSGNLFPAGPRRDSGPWMTITALPASVLGLSALPFGNVPHLLEFPEPGLIYGWEPWLELHPDTASGIGANEDDRIIIRSAEGERECRIVMNDSLHRDVAAIPFEMFGLGEGTWVRENMRATISVLPDSKATSNQPLRCGVAIQIRKA